MFRLSLLATGLLTLTAVAAVSPLVGKDYTSLPPAPAEVLAQIKSAKVTLAKAIETAAEKADGAASSGTMTMVNGKPQFEVMVYGSGKAQRVLVDDTGAVASMTEVPRFPGDAVAGDWTETSTGLRFFDMKVGTGPKPSGPTATVTVHYTGWLVDGTKFDSSVDRGQPASFPLNGVIPGWTEGLQSMAIGGKRKLIIPYKLGYGEMGMGRTIPAKATLIFDVELLETK